VQPSAAAIMSPSGTPGSNSCIRHSRTQPTAIEYAGMSIIVTVARSPGEAVVRAPPSSFALLVWPRTPRRANRIEIRISRFLEGAMMIFAVTSSSVTFRRKQLGEESKTQLETH
jgi:hypothetical protein